MRSITLLAVSALSVQMAAGQSRIVYTLELGGNNHADLWEANLEPTFTPGVTTGTVQVDQGQDLTWAVRVSVGGVHVNPGGPGDGKPPLGAAGLGFDLLLCYADGVTPVPIGAAPLIWQGSQAVPYDAGFWSSINDSDTAGSRGAIFPDLLANAAFAFSLTNQDPAPTQMRRLIDPVTADASPDGPHFDTGFYPAANGRGGTDLAGSIPVDPGFNDPSLAGMLVGFTAGYAAYDYTNYRPGVGVRYLNCQGDLGFGAFTSMCPPVSDPLAPPAGVVEKPLFEGQISTKNLYPGTYVLRVIPNAAASTILHGDVAWNSPTPDYGSWSTFAAPANEVYPDTSDPGMKFQITPCICGCWPAISARRIFYNQSFYDGNKATIDPAPIPGGSNDDSDAIDPSKSPLLPDGGMATFANWTGYGKGINGLMYDMINASQIGSPYRQPVAGDFTFLDIGRDGNAVPVPKTPSGFAIIPHGGPDASDRVIITFANGTIKNTWLKVIIGTGFGLPAPDVHYWGNAVGDTGAGNTPPNILVNAQDEVMCRAPYLHNAFNRAPLNDPSDLNRDSLVNPNDEVLCRPPYVTNAFNCVKMITRIEPSGQIAAGSRLCSGQ